MAALMLTASLAGCGSSEKAESASDPSHGGAGKEEELLTIDMFCAPANYQGVQTGWFGKAIKDACDNKEIGIILVSEKLVKLCPDLIYDLKLHVKFPLIVEIPDRHGTANISDTITQYVREAIGVKI